MLVTNPAAGTDDADDAAAEILLRSLQGAGIECERLALDELPSDPAALADCSTLILSNIAAFDLDERQQHLLASYVRDQGGGLIVLGGDRAFSVGGYAHTPLEEILPVETPRDQLKLLRLGMVIVIDRSGSMVGEKLAVAREAASASVELLSSRDLIGVVAFDSLTEWVVPLQTADNKLSICRRLAALGAGGGTDMYPALLQAYENLAVADTALKHIVALTDGQSAPADFDALAQRCAAAGITISTVAVGSDADLGLLERIARLSGGRMYVANGAHPLPQIFARETILAGRSGLFERLFTPHLRATLDERVIIGFSQPDIPPLRGHVVTVAKPLAQVPLVRATAEGADPILAYWQVGLGRVVAFTSGLWPKWGPEWVAWPGFGKVWAQAVRYAGPPGDRSALSVETAVKQDHGHVVVSAEHLPLSQQERLVLSGQLIRPDFSCHPLYLQRAGLDRFEATFPIDTPGTYLVNLAYDCGGGQGPSGVLRTGVVVAYSPEYRALSSNERLMAEVARRTGGRVIDLRQPDAVFESSSIRPIRLRQPFWEDLVRLALLLFLVDVAVRRIALSPAEAIDRLASRLRELAGGHVGEKSAATLATLRGVKERVRQDGAQRSSAQAPSAPAPAASESGEADPLTQALNGARPDRPVVYPPKTRRRPEPVSETDYLDRLRRAKRRACRPPGQDIE